MLDKDRGLEGFGIRQWRGGTPITFLDNVAQGEGGWERAGERAVKSGQVCGRLGVDI